MTRDEALGNHAGVNGLRGHQAEGVRAFASSRNADDRLGSSWQARRTHGRATASRQTARAGQLRLNVRARSDRVQLTGRGRGDGKEASGAGQRRVRGGTGVRHRELDLDWRGSTPKTQDRTQHAILNWKANGRATSRQRKAKLTETNLSECRDDTAGRVGSHDELAGRAGRPRACTITEELQIQGKRGMPAQSTLLQQA